MSILVGKAIGGENQSLFQRTFILSAQCGFISAFLLSITILLFGESIVPLFTTNIEVKETAVNHLIWMAVYPIVGCWGLQLEGFFSGATEAGPIRDSITLALIIFLAALWLFVPKYNNHGVWLAFVLSSLGRSCFLWLFVPKLNRGKFS